MNSELARLRGTLVRLGENGMAGGLPAPAADELVRALERGASPSELAGVAGLDRRIAATLTGVPISDLPAVLGALTGILAEVDTGARRVRAAASYPLALALAVIVAGSITGGVSVPALSRVASAPILPGVAFVLPATLLVILALSVWTRLPLPFLSEGWRLLDGLAFVASLGALTRVGVPLPAALRASAAWGGRAGALALAYALESGSAPGRAGLVDPFEAAALVAAARAGTLEPTLDALTDQRRIEVARRLPEAVARVHVTSLILAGLAVLAVGVSLFSAYSNALVR